VRSKVFPLEVIDISDRNNVDSNKTKIEIDKVLLDFSWNFDKKVCSDTYGVSSNCLEKYIFPFGNGT